MKQISKKANSFVYTIILINLALIIAYVVFNNMNLIDNTIEYTWTAKEINEILSKKWNLAIESVRQYNSNGWGFVDIIACPNAINIYEKTMEINPETSLLEEVVNNLWTVSSLLTYNLWNIYCKFEALWVEWRINFNDTKFTEIHFNNETRILEEINWELSHEDLFTSNIFLSFIPDYSWNWIDDNFNDDDYTGTSNGTSYPDWYIDDDIIPRLTMFSNVPANSWFYSVFWNNLKTAKIINNNAFNNFSISETIKIWEVSGWKLYLNLSWNDLQYRLRLVKFDKTIYNLEKVLEPIETFTSWVLNSSSWYLSLDYEWNLFLSKISDNENISFNFYDNDYAVFVENLWWDDIAVQLTWVEDWTGRKIILNPIDEYNTEFIEVLSNHITVNDGYYVWEEFIMRGAK